LVYQLDGFSSDAGLVAEAVQPVQLWFAAEPGELALGIDAVPRRGDAHCIPFAQSAANEAARLFIAERIEGPGLAVFFEQHLCFFHQALLEHGGGTLIDALVQIIAVRLETDA